MKMGILTTNLSMLVTESSSFWSHRPVVPVAVIAVACAGLAAGLPRLDTDPVLLGSFEFRRASARSDQRG